MNLIKIRKVISGIILILFILLFLGSEKLSVSLSTFYSPFQFIPALVQNNHAAGSLVHHRSDLDCGDHSDLRQGLLFLPVPAGNASGFADRGIATDLADSPSILFPDR